jgi:hypothetical protein
LVELKEPQDVELQVAVHCTLGFAETSLAMAALRVVELAT